ncbi:hypothetical protein J6590_039507 [Homalodisca vitripennis]|nr:hypothetical protein J6590_039507 [Homalodisca vitripennis]
MQNDKDLTLANNPTIIDATIQNGSGHYSAEIFGSLQGNVIPDSRGQVCDSVRFQMLHKRKRAGIIELSISEDTTLPLLSSRPYVINHTEMRKIDRLVQTLFPSSSSRRLMGTLKPLKCCFQFERSLPEIITVCIPDIRLLTDSVLCMITPRENADSASGPANKVCTARGWKVQEGEARDTRSKQRKLQLQLETPAAYVPRARRWSRCPVGAPDVSKSPVFRGYRQFTAIKTRYSHQEQWENH